MKIINKEVFKAIFNKALRKYHKENVATKQDMLVAGNGISIDPVTKEISVTLDNSVTVVLFELPEITPDNYQQIYELYHGKIVLIPDSGGGEGNWFKEYALYQMPGTVGYRWEIIGEYKADIDLSDYYTKTETNQELAKKQDKLVSGTNIKTINGSSVLGEGNISIASTLFIAKRDQTTAQELIAAYEANKLIVIVPGGTAFTSWSWIAINFVKSNSNQCEIITIFNNGTTLSNGLTLVKFLVRDSNWIYSSQAIQNKLESGTSIKTLNGESLLGAGDIKISTSVEFSIDKDTDTGILGQGNDYFGVDMSKEDSVGLSLTKPGEYGKNKLIPTKDYVDGLKGVFVLDTANPCSYNDLQVAINAPKAIFIKHEGVFYPLIEKWENDEGAKRYVNIATLQRQGIDKGATYFFFEAVIADLASPMAYSSTFVQPTGKPYTDSVVGSLATLNTDNKDNIVAALNEVYEKSGEPFRVKQWATNSLNVTIPTCTSDIGNTSIAKMTFTIDSVEGANYQIVGMIAYEVFDAASGGNRINCWPVCQFTGNVQKELSVRWMCGGTTDKVAKRINAWVLLKHR